MQKRYLFTISRSRGKHYPGAMSASACPTNPLGASRSLGVVREACLSFGAIRGSLRVGACRVFVLSPKVVTQPQPR